MSRIGSTPITIPNETKLEIGDTYVKVEGPKGNLTVAVPNEVKVEQKENSLLVNLKKEKRQAKNLHGLIRALLQNAITGVTQGWTKNIELVGVGYRAQGGGKELNLQVGFSHPVKVTAPEGIEFKVKDSTHVEISGADKKLVGEIAAQIRSIKPPEPYKGKGIRYQGEYIRKKAGKAVKATTAA